VNRAVKIALIGMCSMTTSMKSKLGMTMNDEHPASPVLCFLPCCGTKQASGFQYNNVAGQPLFSKDVIARLESARKGRHFNIDKSSPLTAAFRLYTGSPYQALSSIEGMSKAMLINQLRVWILSAGYGLVDGREPIHDYNEVMQRDVARYWKAAGLVNIIAKAIQELQPTAVYGFFAGNRYWTTSSSSYRYFFSEALDAVLKNTSSIQEAGCFYRESGRGVKAIVNSLGQTFNDFFECDFDKSYAGNIETSGRSIGNVLIRFERFK
jgi:hypothetical protein